MREERRKIRGKIEGKMGVNESRSKNILRKIKKLGMERL